MMISLNGLPIVIMELKNQFIGQSVENSKNQFRDDRDLMEFFV